MREIRFCEDCKKKFIHENDMFDGSYYLCDEGDEMCRYIHFTYCNNCEKFICQDCEKTHYCIRGEK